MKLTRPQTIAAISAINHILLRHHFKGVYDHTLSGMGFIVSGYAGTGKSVVLSKIWSCLVEAGLKGSVVTLTSRAAENLVEKGVPCVTYHSLLYEPILDDNGNLLYFRMKSPSDVIEAIGDFIIFEEVSFINSDIVKTILEMGVPAVMVGDDGQLPAIEGVNIFDLMVDEKAPIDIPILFLEEIKRTAAGSTIPIFCNHLRETGKYDWSLAGNDVQRESIRNLNLKWFKQHWQDWDLIICGTNKTRKKYNRLVRAALGHYSDIPERGERVLCLQNNVVNGYRISNGDLFEVVAAYPGDKISTFQVKKIRPNGAFGPIITVNVDNNFWEEETPLINRERSEAQEFTYGYALTCHKMQGSEMDRVIFVDEDVSFFLSQTKYRYTAGTRAKEKLLVVS